MLKTLINGYNESGPIRYDRLYHACLGKKKNSEIEKIWFFDEKRNPFSQ